MERPKPHPGHQLKPKLSSGHKLACGDPETVKNRNRIALTHISNSSGKCLKSRKRIFIFIDLKHLYEPNDINA